MKTWLLGRAFLLLLASTPALAQVSPTMRTGIPDAVYVDRYAPDARAAAAQTALHLAKAPHLGAPVSLTPDQPYADGVALNIWKPSFVLGTDAGGEIGINFWGLHTDGHINIAFASANVKPQVLDCRVLSPGPVSYKVYSAGADKPVAEGKVPLFDHHLLMTVPDKATLVELWPTPSTAVLGFFGCDLSAME